MWFKIINFLIISILIILLLSRTNRISKLEEEFKKQKEYNKETIRLIDGLIDNQKKLSNINDDMLITYANILMLTKTIENNKNAIMDAKKIYQNCSSLNITP